MKQLLVFYLLILFTSLGACTVDSIGDLLAEIDKLPDCLAACIVGSIEITWYVVLLLIIGLYEVVVRIIPAVARFSLIALIIDILKLISDYLKRKKR
ncbi:MAG: hypothetical protein D4R45_03420 [Planctomycetaceae bacterium]|nr:MAG: hypothetical protein D4R45_03420 [Planctomycetaceae bacterium]